MRRRVLTTFGFGPHGEMLRVSLPTHAAYAARHGYDLFVPQPAFFAGVGGREASWMKVPLISALLGTAGYDEVLWLDCDVAVLRHDRDIADDCGDAPMHVVVHRTGDGAVPNLGVWFVRKEFVETLGRIWNAPTSRRSACWWEQAAAIHVLGGDPDADSISVPAGPLWGELPYEWNPHVYDARGIVGDARFFHATQFADRVAEMQRRIASAS